MSYAHITAQEIGTDGTAALSWPVLPARPAAAGGAAVQKVRIKMPTLRGMRLLEEGFFLVLGSGFLTMAGTFAWQFLR